MLSTLSAAAFHNDGQTAAAAPARNRAPSQEQTGVLQKLPAREMEKDVCSVKYKGRIIVVDKAVTDLVQSNTAELFFIFSSTLEDTYPHPVSPDYRHAFHLYFST